ncbi:hypothetical protein, partial [Frankia sp. CIT1]|uniref:hypothetical protein n=1 Tax=Frankia sp. CIT1 TaxID=2880974 RepID=UPI001EF7043B
TGADGSRWCADREEGGAAGIRTVGAADRDTGTPGIHGLAAVRHAPADGAPCGTHRQRLSGIQRREPTRRRSAHHSIGACPTFLREYATHDGGGAHARRASAGAAPVSDNGITGVAAITAVNPIIRVIRGLRGPAGTGCCRHRH